ncbi:MAG: tRNA-dihydrouridine synthase [Candidatus Margulisiibacteriota bacterium]
MPNIGDLSFTSPIVVAPLCGISDFPFRQLARDFGAELTYTEMLSAVAIQQGIPASLNFSFVKDEHPVSVQLFGRSPEAFAYAAAHYASLGADIIDINMGCSVKKVLKQGAGAALQRDLTLVKKVLRALRRVLSIPLTLKCRLGWSSLEENFIDLAQLAQDEGVDAICLHPRYATQLFTGTADWSKFNALRSHTSLPIIGSGDVKASEQIKEKLRSYPIQFVMVGRALIGNPWLISDFHQSPNPALRETLCRHFELLCAYYPEKKAAHHFRKYIAKYLKGHPRARELRLLGNEFSCQADFVRFIDLEFQT